MYNANIPAIKVLVAKIQSNLLGLKANSGLINDMDAARYKLNFVDVLPFTLQLTFIDLITEKDKVVIYNFSCILHVLIFKTANKPHRLILNSEVSKEI